MKKKVKKKMGLLLVEKSRVVLPLILFIPIITRKEKVVEAVMVEEEVVKAVEEIDFKRLLLSGCFKSCVYGGSRDKCERWA